MSNSDDENKKYREANEKLRATHVKLPPLSGEAWLNNIRNKIGKDTPKATEDRIFCGNGLLFQTYSESRLPAISHELVKNAIVDVTVTGDDPLMKNVGKLGVLGLDLHDDLFPSYMRITCKPLEELDDFDELNDTALVIRRNCAMPFSPSPEGVYSATTKAFDYRQFQRDMQFLGRTIDLNHLPPCPILEPKAFYTWMHHRKLSMSSDALFSETNEQTDINDFYAAWSLYKSFKFHGGSEANPHKDIAFAGCSWTVTRPTREFPAIVMSVCRFDPLAYYFEDRSELLPKYKDILAKRKAGKDPVPQPVETSTFAYTNGEDSATVDPTGLTEDQLDRAVARLKADGKIGKAIINPAMTYETLPDQEDCAEKMSMEAQQVMISAIVSDFLDE